MVGLNKGTAMHSGVALGLESFTWYFFCLGQHLGSDSFHIPGQSVASSCETATGWVQMVRLIFHSLKSNNAKL